VGQEETSTSYIRELGKRVGKRDRPLETAAFLHLAAPRFVAQAALE
jgi:hypothetical protein